MKDAISYTIKIEATVERVEKAGREWERKSADSSEMAYTPEIEKTVRRVERVFEQTVDSLDMAKLVQVVNGLL